MIDFKYHIASLAAVFLALAVGILIGTSVVGTSSVENQIRKLKSGFDHVQLEDRKLRNENEQLRQQSQMLENALRQVAPAVVQGQLLGKHIAIIAAGRAPEATLLREIKYFLSASGATVSSITTIQDSLIPENQASRQIILSRTGIDGQDPDRARWQLVVRIVRNIIMGRSPETMRILGQYSPGLGIDGDYSLPADGVVFLSSGDKEEARALEQGTSLLAHIADTLREQGVTAAACEQQECSESLMPYFARYNLATVDGVDTPLGKIALVYALAGKQGHYGTKPSAAQVLPDINTEQINRARAVPTHSLLPAPPAPLPQRESPLPARGRSKLGPANR